MSNVNVFQQEDNFTTRLASKVDAADTTIEVQSSVSFTFSQNFDISVNPGKSNYEPMTVTGISGTTWTVTRARPRYTGDAGVAQTHGAGSTVIISNNQAVFADNRTAINSKLDNDGGNSTTSWDLQVSGNNWRHRMDGDDMKFTDNNNPEVTLSTLTAAAGVDTKVRVSNDDTTSGFLNGKLVAGSGITFTEGNPGGDETLTIAAGADSTTYTAAEAIATNVPVAKNGTADEVVNLLLKGIGTDVEFDTGTITLTSVCEISTKKYAVAFYDGSNLSVIICDVASKVPTFGTAVVAHTGTLRDLQVDIAKLDTDKFVVISTQDDTNDVANIRIATVSGTVPTFGAETQISASTNNAFYTSIAPLDTDKFIAIWHDATTGEMVARAGTVSGTTPTLGTEVNVASTASANFTSICQTETDKVFASYNDSSNTNGDGVVMTVSGTTITVGTPVSFDTSAVAYTSCAKMDTDKAMVVYRDSSSDWIARFVSISGTTPSYGTLLTVFEGSVNSVASPRSLVGISTTAAATVFSDSTSTYVAELSVSGTDISLAETITTVAEDSLSASVALVDAGSKTVLTIFDDVGDTGDGTANVVSLDGNEDAYIGVSAEAIAASASGLIQREGVLAGFSGLTIGERYYAGDGGVTTTAGSIFIGVAKDTDEIDMGYNDLSKLATGEQRHFRHETTRAAATASGTEIIQLPFTPTFIQFFTYGNAGSATSAKSIGSWLSDSDQGCVATSGAGVDERDSANVIVIDKDGTDSQKATAAVYGNVLTLTWTKANSGEEGFVEINAFK